MQKKQIVVLVAVMAIMGYLFFLPVKGLKKQKSGDGHTNAPISKARKVNQVSVEMVSAAAKVAIGNSLAAQLTDLEKQLKSSNEGPAKLALQKQLAKKWDDVNQQAPAAFYYLEIAKQENTFNNWLEAGRHFNEAFKFTQDTVVQPFFVVNALNAYKNAIKLNSKSLDAKTGLGIAFVNQTSLGMADADGGSPMQGIMMLLDVVKQDPNNINANLSLGMFAMKSGQYDKAVLRFKTIIAQKPNDLEPYFYMAESYKQLGMNKEALAAYQKCKELNPDPDFGQQINNYIKDITKK